jgi:hypothetical protein
MLLSPEKVEIIILAVCALHNFLRVRNTNMYFPPSSVDREDKDLRKRKKPTAALSVKLATGMPRILRHKEMKYAVM